MIKRMDVKLFYVNFHEKDIVTGLGEEMEVRGRVEYQRGGRGIIWRENTVQYNLIVEPGFRTIHHDLHTIAKGSKINHIFTIRVENRGAENHTVTWTGGLINYHGIIVIIEIGIIKAIGAENKLGVVFVYRFITIAFPTVHNHES